MIRSARSNRSLRCMAILRRTQVLDPQLHTGTALPFVDFREKGDINLSGNIPLRHAKGNCRKGLFFSHQPQTNMSLTNHSSLNYRHATHHQHRLGIAGSKRFKSLQLYCKFFCNISGLYLRINRQCRDEIGSRQHTGGFELKTLCKRRYLLFTQPNTGSIAVTSETIQMLRTGCERIQQVKARYAAPGTFSATIFRQGDQNRRAMIAFNQSRGNDAYHPLMPFGRSKYNTTTIFNVVSGKYHCIRFFKDPTFNCLALGIGSIKLCGNQLTFLFIITEQKVDPRNGTFHATGCVQTWSQSKTNLSAGNIVHNAGN